jgi:outer membrane protein OmpU
MKKVLLTTTAVVFTAGFASAGDMSMSGAIKLTYGSFGTGSQAGAAVDDFAPEADLDIAATSSSGSISMTGTLELDEDGAPDVGPITISTGALTFTYDTNDMGALAVAPDGSWGGAGDDGETNNYGDYSVAFSAGGVGVTYTRDQETSDNVMAVTYAAGALSLSLTSIDETNGPTDVTGGLQYGSGDVKTTIGATYVTGPYTIAISGDDQNDQDWDASVAMASGDTTITVAADETEMMSVGIAYTNGAMTLSARQEFNNPNSADDETEFGLSYTEGALTFGANYDSGQANHFGDEAELLLSAGYTDGDVSIAAKGTDRDEMEVSVTFAF